MDRPYTGNVYERDGNVYVEYPGGGGQVFTKKERASHQSGAWDKHNEPFWFFIGAVVILVAVAIYKLAIRRWGPH